LNQWHLDRTYREIPCATSATETKALRAVRALLLGRPNPSDVYATAIDALAKGTPTQKTDLVSLLTDRMSALSTLTAQVLAQIESHALVESLPVVENALAAMEFYTLQVAASSPAIPAETTTGSVWTHLACNNQVSSQVPLWALATENSVGVPSIELAGILRLPAACVREDHNDSGSAADLNPLAGDDGCDVVGPPGAGLTGRFDQEGRANACHAKTQAQAL
jgi:hypothetical protein